MSTSMQSNPDNGEDPKHPPMPPDQTPVEPIEEPPTPGPGPDTPKKIVVPPKATT